MVLTLLKTSINKIMNPFYSLLARLGVKPDFVTIMGLVFAVLAGYGFAISNYWLALLGIFLTGFSDMVDGGVARASGNTTVQGAFLDSVVDRLGETGIYTGIIIGFTSGIGQMIGILLLAAAFSVSYLRARGESLGVDMAGIGIMERAERMIFLGFTAIAGIFFLQSGVLWMLGLMLLLTTYTVLQRFGKGYFDLGKKISAADLH
jgi:phosphatidylglycerophosphate synthase